MKMYEEMIIKIYKEKINYIQEYERGGMTVIPPGAWPHLEVPRQTNAEPQWNDIYNIAVLSWSADVCVALHDTDVVSINQMQRAGESPVYYYEDIVQQSVFSSWLGAVHHHDSHRLKYVARWENSNEVCKRTWISYRGWR